MQEWSNSNKPVIRRGDGFYLIHEHGKKFLDGIASMWCNVWGHGNNEISKAMIKQIQTIQHSTLFGLANAPSSELSEMLIRLAKGMSHVFYSDNGSTAIEVAMKMALQYWKNRGKKKNQIRFDGKWISRRYNGGDEPRLLTKVFCTLSTSLRRAIKIPLPVCKSGYSDCQDYENLCLEKTEVILANNSLSLLRSCHGKWSPDSRWRVNLPEELSK